MNSESLIPGPEDSDAEVPLRILVADDNTSDRMILRAIVRKQGYEVLTAENGRQAVDVFAEHRPHIVLMDALMPEMDGFEATRLIKEMAGEELVPVIFLTSLKDTHSLVDCLEAGGDDFLSKPYNPTILQAKINAFNRMRRMHHVLQRQRDEISLHNKRLIHEQSVAKRVFDNVAHSGCLDAANIKHLLSPLAVFNGDVLLASRTPSGNIFILLGDFTGHGLPAAIGAMPLAEIFYSMASKGYAMVDVLREVNQRLKKILPTGFFCCAGTLDINFHKKTVEVWNGGLPDGLIFHQSSKSLTQLKSRHLPLGIMGNDRFSDKTEIYTLEEGDRIYLYSDGILEASNSQDQMFGEERLASVFYDNQTPDQLFDEIGQAVNAFAGLTGVQDDLTLVEVRMCDPEELVELAEPFASSRKYGPSDWSFSYELYPNTLKTYNPLPLLLQVIMEMPALRRFSGQIYTLLSELFANSLEHGLLSLSSEAKSDISGFAAFYAEREKRLANLDEGYIQFHFSHRLSPQGGVLTLAVRDSGAGFDVSRIRREFSSQGYSGRGLALMHSLCDDVRFNESGNSVEMDFRWYFET
ncbi:SpoIIE family protein phosphatase [Pokkaliibacter sp. CJK22405]|uniref:ATP-binding SpoIIE family protein phosphatase n=1 Tax=Pokkaliibacter sp. CJK22405 TaxID=3384615 RepID=UPI003984FD57